MRTMAINEYGSADQFTPTERPKPTIGPGEVLIRVAAASVNPFDWKRRAGYLAAFMPARFPLVLGLDVSGTVEAVGEGVTDFAPGDEVYSMAFDCGGTYAEYVAAPAAIVARKPASLDLTSAAAIPLVGLAASRALAALQLQPGETVVIGGASGGVGSIAVQLAAKLGAHVIGIASDQNLDYVRSLGAQEAVAYDSQDAAAAIRAAHPGGVDALLDVTGGDALLQLADTLREGGRLTSITADPGTIAQVQERGVNASGIFAVPSAETLTELARLIDDGQLSVKVSAVMPLEEVAWAHQLVESGQAHGKVVLTVI